MARWPPNLNDGIFAVTWTLEHAIAVNPGGVNGPIALAVLEKDRKGQTLARMIEETELDEVRQHIEETKNALRQFRINYLNPEKSLIPEIPRFNK